MILRRRPGNSPSEREVAACTTRAGAGSRADGDDLRTLGQCTNRHSVCAYMRPLWPGQSTRAVPGGGLCGISCEDTTPQLVAST
jgi:hypothetical protein